MHNLIAITPLGATEPVTDVVGSRTLSEKVDRALASIASRLGQEAATKAMIAELIGTEVPGPGRATSGTVAAFWTGPDQWMVEAPFATHEDLAAQIATRSGGVASVTEQTDGWCRFDLQGPALADVFALLCPLDYPSFTGGEATRTSIEHLGCFVICRASDHASIIGPRSAAGSLHHTLLKGMRAA